MKFILYEFVLTMFFTFAIITTINFVVTRLLTNKAKRENSLRSSFGTKYINCIFAYLGSIDVTQIDEGGPIPSLKKPASIL